MKRRLSTVIAGIICMGMIATGCGSSKESDSAVSNVTDGGSIVRAIPTDVANLNPLYQIGDEGVTMLKPIFDPLYIVGKDEVRYYLAESREVSEDGLSITVKLRDNLKWHDGESITSDDVVFNFDMRANPENKITKGTKIKDELVKVEKIDELTFKVVLPSVSASYDAILGGIQLIPKHIYEGEVNISASEKNMLGIGSGPLKVKEWNQGQNLVLERFDDYYREKTSLDSAVFKFIPNESNQEVALQNGEINMMRITSQEKYDKYSKDDKYKLFSLKEGRINYMGFNNNSEIMKEQKAREAISYALNVDEIIAGAYGSEVMSDAAKTVFCESNFYYTDIDGYKQDIEKAKQLIKEAGLEGKTLKLIYNSSRPNMEDCALIIQQQLKAVGLDLQINGYETQGFFEMFFHTDRGDWDLGLNGYIANGDNQAHKEMFSGEGSYGRNLVSNEKIDQLWRDGEVTIDSEKRKEIYTQIQEEIKSIYSIYPISTPNYIIAVDKQYEGLDAIDMVPVFEDYTKIHKVK